MGESAENGMVEEEEARKGGGWPQTVYRAPGHQRFDCSKVGKRDGRQYGIMACTGRSIRTRNAFVCLALEGKEEGKCSSFC